MFSSLIRAGRSSFRVVKVVLILAWAISALSTPACAQSVWQQIKDEAKKAKQQVKQGTQPQPAQQPAPQAQARPGHDQAERRPDGGGMNTSASFTPPAGTRIEPALMAPFQQGAAFGVSPLGVHVASKQMSGSREIIVYDGTPGPKFDHLLQGPANTRFPVRFSPDGNHWAYCAAQGSEWVVMLDGKELARGPGSPDGTVDAGYCEFGFTPQSNHFFFTSLKNARDVSGVARFYWDGKPGPWGAPSGLNFYVFSPDGNHVAYQWTEPMSRTPRQQFYLDNEPAPYNAGLPQWTADSKHLYTVRDVQVPGKNGYREALLDGKPFLRADNVELHVAPAGDLVVAKVTRIGADMKRSYFLTVGSKLVPGSETPNEINQIVFSPDGKHYAAVYRDNTGRGWVLSDGKRGQSYAMVGGQGELKSRAAYTPDSSKLVYTASTLGSGSGTGAFVVINDQESDALMPLSSTVIAPAGNRVATTGGGQVTLDGKLLQLPNVDPQGMSASLLSFSPDGSHYAFVINNRGDATLYLDGVPQSGYRAFAAVADLERFDRRPYVWSPDGKHIAYFCRSANPASGDEAYLCYDNKAVRVGAVPSTLAALMFSADSNHLYWAWKEAGLRMRVFADGKPVYEADSASQAGFAPETYQSTPDGSLVVLMQDDKGLQRVTITPPPNSSAASLVGNGGSLAKAR